MHKVRTCAEDRQITQDCHRILGSTFIVKPNERVDKKLRQPLSSRIYPYALSWNGVMTERMGLSREDLQVVKLD